MKKAILILNLGITLLFFSCGPSMEEKRRAESTSDTTSVGFTSSTAAVENNKDTSRKFIRTADLKFKVKSVISSTYTIEDIAAHQGGFVTYTNLTSNTDNVTTTAVSADSSLETTYYTATNTMTIRVPNTRLDTTLKEISANIDYLDYRIIKADDVALQILANSLTQKRSAKNEERLKNAILSQAKKLNETTNAEELLLSKQEQADMAKISNLALIDQISFSTVNLIIYQRQSIKRELILNVRNIDAYEPGFGSQILESMMFGWDILEAFIVFLTKLWGLFVFAIAVYILYRIVKHQSGKKHGQGG